MPRRQGHVKRRARCVATTSRPPRPLVRRATPDAAAERDDGPIGHACAAAALLAHALGRLAAQRRTARAAAAAAAGLDAAVAMHRLNEALAWLFDAEQEAA
jgi:hypothetical protein